MPGRAAVIVTCAFGVLSIPVAAHAGESTGGNYLATLEYLPVGTYGLHFSTHHCNDPAILFDGPVVPYVSAELTNEPFRQSTNLFHEQVIRQGRLRLGGCPPTRMPASLKVGAIADFVRFGFRDRDGLRQQDQAALLGFEVLVTIRLERWLRVAIGYQQLFVVGTGASQPNIDAEAFVSLPLGPGVPVEPGLFLATNSINFDWRGLGLRAAQLRLGLAVLW